jgi:hypothetical protein
MREESDRPEPEAVVRTVIARSRATLARLVGSLQMVEFKSL